MGFPRRRTFKNFDSPEEARRQAMDQALTLLKFRPRSQAELSQRLSEKGFDKTIVGDTMKRLAEVSLVNDALLARSVVSSRRRAHQGDHKIRRELRQRGFSAEMVEQAFAEDEGAAPPESRVWEALMKRAPRLSRLEPKAARRRLEAYLFRQGFEADDIRPAIRRYFAGEEGEN